MPFTPINFQNDPSTATPVSAANLNYLQTQYAEAMADMALTSGLIVNVMAYGAVADGVTDDTAAINAAITAVPNYGTVVIPAGTYALDGTIVNGGKSIRVSAYGAVFVKNTATAAVSFVGAYDTTVPVSGLTSGIIAASNYGVTLTVSGTMPWVRGDVVKVFSDDVLPGSLADIPVPAATAPRSGQFFTVYSVALNEVKLLGDLIDPLTTNVRAARLTDVSTVWEGGTFTVTDNYVASSFTQGGFSLSTMRRPVVRDVRIARPGSSAFAMVGNCGYLVDNSEVDWGRDESGAGHFSYAVTDTVSSFGVVRGCRFFQPRHGYTTNYSGTTAGGGTPRQYGRTFGTKVIDTVVDSASNSAFDTHSDGEQIHFIGCTALNSLNGFHLRGRRNQVIDGTVKRSNIAVRTASDSDAGQSYGHTIDGLVVDDVATVVQMVTRGGGTHPDSGVLDTRSNTVRNVTARGVTLEALDLTNVTADMDSIYVEFTGAFSSAAPLNPISNSDLTAGRIRMEFAGASGTNANLFDIASSVCDIEDLKLTGPSGMSTVLARVINVVSGTTTIRTNIISDYAPGTAWVGGTIGSNSWVKWQQAVGVNGPSSAYTPLTDATVQADIIQAVTRRRDPVITLEYTLGASQTLADLPNASRGQVLIIQNSSSAGRNITVNHGTTPNTNLAGGTTKTIQPGQCLVLVYATNIWNHRTFV